MKSIKIIPILKSLYIKGKIYDDCKLFLFLNIFIYFILFSVFMTNFVRIYVNSMTDRKLF